MSRINQIGDNKQAIKPTGFNSNKGSIVAFFLFIPLSFLLWYLNALGNEIEADIKYPLTCSNVPEIFEQENLPQKLTLYLEGTGYSLLKFKFGGKDKPINLDFSHINYRRYKSGNGGQYYIVTSGLMRNITEQLDPDCSISKIGPDTIFLSTLKK